MQDIGEKLYQLVVLLGGLVGDLLQLGLHWSLLIAWLAWWLWGVNWRRVWPVLGRGAWLPVVLLMIMAALAWSRIQPSDCTCLGFTTVLNFWWQLGAVGLLVAGTLFCGWLQGQFGWAPAEIDLEPPLPEAHGHEHH
jgi:hypothetical protein